MSDIVFCARKVNAVDGHWYANLGYYAQDANRKAWREGGRLCRWNLQTRKTTVLLDAPQGTVRDPQVHYDGQRILFAYRKGGSEYLNLYEINADGSGLRQLTDGPFDDLEPSYLPSGDIVFVSTRCQRWVNCWYTQVAVLHRCDAQGRNIRALSSNNEQDNTPWPLPDGRILYTRWEYVDRSQLDYHHLWVSNPDGTAAMILHGNQHPGTVMIDAKPIPGSDKVVAIFSPGHGQREHAGAVTIVDPQAGPDDPRFARPFHAGQQFRDPYALSEDRILVARNASLVLLTRDGVAHELFTLPEADIRAGMQLHEPRPLVRRDRESVVPDRVRTQEPTGRLLLSDVYDGRNMEGIKRGEIKKLLVLETLPMPIHYSGGMEPISCEGTFTLERVVGTVPVERDGSAYFELPALRSFFFVALDEQDKSVKRMQSFVTVQPGETTSCVGCHEPRTRTPAASRPTMAASRKPSATERIADVPEVIEFPRDVQPILDRHCLKCHDYDGQNRSRAFLCGDRGPVYSHAYYTLTALGQVSDGRNRAKSNYAPRTLGSAASPLMQKLGPAHHDVHLSPPEKKTVRLWIESAAAYPGTYAALGTGMIGGYFGNDQDRQDMNWPETKSMVVAVNRRCGSCHSGTRSIPLSPSYESFRPALVDMTADDPRRRMSRHLVYNLTRPEKSLLLLAPLDRTAGGLGLCTSESDGSAAGVFKASSDPDYRAILTGIRRAARHLNEIKRFDMPGFRPRAEWVREMKRFGIVPSATDASAVLDVYAVERKYWESLWYQPR